MAPLGFGPILTAFLLMRVRISLTSRKFLFLRASITPLSLVLRYIFKGYCFVCLMLFRTLAAALSSILELADLFRVVAGEATGEAAGVAVREAVVCVAFGVGFWMGLLGDWSGVWTESLLDDNSSELLGSVFVCLGMAPWFLLVFG